jgi:hypothetical protein
MAPKFADIFSRFASNSESQVFSLYHTTCVGREREREREIDRERER